MPYPYTSYNGYYQNGFTPYSYSPYQQPQQMPQQPIIQNAPQAAQTVSAQAVVPSNPASIIWVRNQQDAAMYPVAPNNAVALWDSSAPSIYLKQADASGKPSMKIYDLVERTETTSEAASEKDAKSPAYATKEDLAAVVGVVKGFDGLISSMKSDIEKMSGDLYGIAGKKKNVKKQESEDEA